MGCEQIKPVGSFHRRAKSKDGLQTRCKSCHAVYNDKHYHNNKELYRERANKYRKQLHEWFYDLKRKICCERCGEDKHWRLAFHHIDPSEKDMTVSEFLRNHSKKKLENEIKKCIPLCHNCHADVHYEERQNRSRSG